MGLDADIVVYDPEREFVVRNDENQHGALDHTIWETARFKGYPSAVYSRGKLVFNGKNYVGRSGDGRFLKCNKVRFSGPEL